MYTWPLSSLFLTESLTLVGYFFAGLWSEMVSRPHVPGVRRQRQQASGVGPQVRQRHRPGADVHGSSGRRESHRLVAPSSWSVG